jgi:hypothetical protein
MSGRDSSSSFERNSDERANPQTRNAVMLHLVEFIATLTAALFAGAALYINLVEHPARLSLGTTAALLEWAPSYRRATWMQAPLALVSFVCGLASAWMGGGPAWAAAALSIGAVVPFTFLGLMPTNRSLLTPSRDLGSPETRYLLDKWAKLHAVRTALSLLATALYLWLALGL